MISRRDFLKTVGAAGLAVAAAGVLAGCSTNDVPNPNPAPAPDGSNTTPAVETVTLENGITLTVEKTARQSVLPNSTTGKQYLGIRIRVKNDTTYSKKNNAKFANLTTKNFKCNASGSWEFPYEDDKFGKMDPVTGEWNGNARLTFLEEALDTVNMGYYGKDYDPATGEEGLGFGAPDTDLTAGLVFTTDSATKNVDLYVTYGSKVFKFNLDI